MFWHTGEYAAVPACVCCCFYCLRTVFICVYTVFVLKMMSSTEQGLSWMVAQELGEMKGGILADEMGLGKTIQTISLLMEAKQRGTGSSAVKGKGKAKKKSRAAAGTGSEDGGEAFLYCIYMPAIDRSLSDCRWADTGSAAYVSSHAVVGGDSNLRRRWPKRANLLR